MTHASRMSIACTALVFTVLTGCGTGESNSSVTGSFVAKSQTSSLPPDQAMSGALYKPVHNGIPAPVRLNQLQRSNTYYNLMMADTQNGYRSGFIAGHFVMQATKDRGTSWYPIALPTSWNESLIAKGNGQAENPTVRVVDDKTFYVFTVLSNELVVWRATDSGRHFKVEHFPLTKAYQMESVSTLGDQDSYILLRGIGKNLDTHELLHVTAQGTKIQPMHLVKGATDAGLPATAKGVATFGSEKDGTVAATTTDGRLHVYQTRDGGKTWLTRSLTPPKGLNGWMAVRVYQPVQLGPEKTFVARYVGTKGGRAAIKTVVYQTRDNGYTFSSVVADRLTDAAADYLGNPVQFINPDYGFTISDGRLLMTTDSGNSWKTQHTPVLERRLHQYPRVLDIDFISANTAFVVLQSSDYRQTLVLRSNDGGLSFEVVREL